MNYLAESMTPEFKLVFFIIFFICLVPIFILVLISFLKLITKNIKKTRKLKKRVSKNKYLDYFGLDNVISVSKNLSRVTIIVKDLNIVNLDALKNEGIGIMITGNTIKCSSQAFADQIE